MRPAATIWAAIGVAVLVSWSACAPGATARVASSARRLGAPFAVSPAPGSAFNEPDTQISFLGASAQDLRGITVTGSLSGLHSGRIEADSDGQGASFLPARPFLAGETVSVATHAPLVGARSGKFSFSVGTPGVIRDASAGQLLQLALRVPGPDSVQSFRSRPDLSPAAVTVTIDRAPLRDGDIFVAPELGPVQSGPMILNPAGQLVWFDPMPVLANRYAMNFRVQSLRGQPVLTWWQGTKLFGNGNGEGVILNDHYQRIATVRAGNGLQMDEHEFLLTPRGDAYIVALSPLMLPGFRLPVLDDVIQEIDVRTGLVLYEWNPLGHIPLTNTYATPGVTGPMFDPYHINSISLAHGGNLIVSMRNTSTVYDVDHRTGAVLWRLGGKRSSFTIGPGAEFAYQHDVTMLPGGTLTMFDDGGGLPNTFRIRPFSRGLELSLNSRTMTATIDRQYLHDPPIGANWEGSLQLLRGGEAFIGWGGPPYFSEDNALGQQDFSANFNFPTATYRAERFVWNGQPTTRPNAVIGTSSDGATDVYASWNGATDVARWVVLADESGRLHRVASEAPTGFETAIRLGGGYRRVEVEALGQTGHVLGTSAVLRASG